MLKKIKSLFVIEEETKKNQAGNPDPKVVSASGKDMKSAPDPKKINKASIDQFVRVLADAIQRNNIEGYDYLEYKEAVKSLEKLEAEESKRFITAYTLAQTMGAKKDALLKSASYYLQVLGEEESKFGTALQKQIEEKLNSGSETVKKFEDNISKKSAEIKKLEEEIDKLKKNLAVKKEEIEKSTLKVTTVKNSFDHAYNSIVKQIKEDINKIEEYLK